MTRLTLAIPSYNECANVRPVYENIVAALAKNGVSDQVEIIFVDDGSSDGSAGPLGEIAAEDPRVRVFRHSENRGLGAALRTALESARGEFFTFIPGDGEVAAEEALSLWRAANDVDLVIGERETNDEETRRAVRPWFRTALSRANIAMTRRLLGMPFTGTEGIYVVRRTALRNLKLRSTTGLVNLEILSHCYRTKGRIVRRGMLIRPRLSGRSKVATPRGILRQLWETMRLRFVSGTPLEMGR